MMSLLLLAATAFAAPVTYEIDPVHSYVGFEITHMMVSTVRGEFGSVSGTLTWDPAKPTATTANGVVGVASVDTRDPKRDEHLRAPDFFDAAKFPEMKFTSKEVKNVGKDGFDLVGDLTIRGVTKSVTFRVATPAAERTDPWKNVKSGTRATTVINRQDFGVTWNQSLDQGGLLVGDEVKITLELELNRKP